MNSRRRKCIIVVGLVLCAVGTMGRFRCERHVELVPAPLVMRAIDRNTTAPQLAALLNANPSLISDRDGNGDLLIHHAAREGRPEVVRLVLQRGADPNAEGKGLLGSTPLMIAVMSHRKEIVLILLDAGADPTGKTSFGTPLEFAEGEGLDEIAQVLRKAAKRPNADETPISPPSPLPLGPIPFNES